MRLAVLGQGEVRASITRPLAETFTRPDILDREGRLLATDIEAPTLYADPSLILDLDEVIEGVSSVLTDIDVQDLRRQLADRSRRFVRLRRGVPPRVAQRIHDLGIPGLAFRMEPKRVYPAGGVAGHVLGHVNTDNKGMAGIEGYIDESVGIEASNGFIASPREPVRLTLDLGVQHALESELADAATRYSAPGAAGLVLDAETGAVLAAASLPTVDPARPSQSLERTRLDKLTVGTYELGSIFKTMTVAMAIDQGLATPDTVYDVRAPLRSGSYTIRDLHPLGRPLTVRDIFIHSSNVGAGMIALQAGTDRQRAFLDRLGLLEPIRTQAGPVAPPRTPERWGQIETITVSYGHGLAVAPLQFAAAAAAIVNGGFKVTPTFLGPVADLSTRPRVLRAETSDAMRELMRRNVTSRSGTGRRADVPGYEVGGKTGTAEMPGRGGYREKAVIASFLGAFPMSRPRYIVLVLLHQPEASEETKGQLTAGLNAAPATARIIERIAPILGIVPAVQRVDDSVALTEFDGRPRPQ